MFNLIKNLFEGEKQMARTKQYVVYTREFSKGRVNNKVGVFLDEAKNFPLSFQSQSTWYSLINFLICLIPKL